MIIIGFGTLTLLGQDVFYPVLGLVAVAVAALIFGFIRARRVTSAVALPFGFKFLGVLLLALCVLEPARVDRVARPGANVIAMLADDSRSLLISDSGKSHPRGDGLRALLAPNQPWMRTLANTFALRSYTVADRLRRVPDFANLDFKGSASRLGLALNEVGERYRGAPLSAIVLLSDGIATDAPELVLPLDLPPVYVVPIGDPMTVPDLALLQVDARDTAFEDAPVTLDAQIEAVGLAGQKFNVDLLGPGGDIAQTTNLLVRTNDERLSARFELGPGKPGVTFHSLRLRAPGIAQATTANDARTVMVNRPRGPLRILFVGGRPSWEFKFLRRGLEPDREVEVVALMRMASREPKFVFQDNVSNGANPFFKGFGQDDDQERYDEPVLVRFGTKDANELQAGFPKTDAELFTYHGLILDDVEASFFSADQQSVIERFVTVRGGGFLMLGGVDTFAEGGYARTPIANILPFDVSAPSVGTAGPGADFDLTREGWREPWVRLRATETAEHERLAAMPPFQVLSRMGPARPGATVLATIGSGATAATGVLAVQRTGQGRAAALAIGDLWRWGLRAGADPAAKPDKGHGDLGKFWRQTVRWLVAESPGRVQVQAVRRDDEKGTFRIEVRVRDADFQPAVDASCSIEIAGPKGEKTNLLAMPDPGEAGLFTAGFSPNPPGGYLLHAKAQFHDQSFAPVSETGFVFEPDADEHRRLRPDRARLEALARRTQGRLVEAVDLDAWAKTLPGRPAPVTDTRTTPLWHSASVFGLALACFAAEWILRRRRGLA